MPHNLSPLQTDAAHQPLWQTDDGAGRLSMETGAADKLAAWFCGAIALSRAEAHRLLDEALQSGWIAHHRAEYVAAVKALAAGPRSWQAMGYRLLPDD